MTKFSLFSSGVMIFEHHLPFLIGRFVRFFSPFLSYHQALSLSFGLAGLVRLEFGERVRFLQ